METSTLYRDYVGDILGLCWDTGKQNRNLFLGLRVLEGKDSSSNCREATCAKDRPPALDLNTPPP